MDDGALAAGTAAAAQLVAHRFHALVAAPEAVLGEERMAAKVVGRRDDLAVGVVEAIAARVGECQLDAPPPPDRLLEQ
jgi:hypothetical protein